MILKRGKWGSGEQSSLDVSNLGSLICAVAVGNQECQFLELTCTEAKLFVV